MGKSKVALVACHDYEPANVKQAISTCFELLGGAESFVKKSDKVLLKPNLLIGIKPERAVTTHPEVVRAIAVEVNQAGGSCLIGDGPMFATSQSALRRCGYKSVMEEQNIKAPDMERKTLIRAENSRSFKRFEVSEVIDHVQVLINVCKLKTHGISGLTLSIKNLFGLIPGLEKSKWHLKAPSHIEMSSMVFDLYEAIDAHLSEKCQMLHIADGIYGLEGEGPSSAGKPRYVGALAASFDPAALDAVLAQLVGFKTDDVTTTKIAAERGKGNPYDIEIVGDDLEKLKLEKPFEPCRRSLRSGAPPETGWPMNIPFFRDRMVERPVIDLANCTGCKDCSKVCAAEAITISGKPPKASIDYDKCIRCYCCSEACKYAAARLGPRPLLAKIADRRHLIPWITLSFIIATLGTLGWFLFLS